MLCGKLSHEFAGVNKMATYKPYSREYKIRMLEFAGDRIEACFRNIKTYTAYSLVATDREIKAKAFCIAMKERDLLRFLNAFKEISTAEVKA